MALRDAIRLPSQLISRIVRDVQGVMTMGSQYTRNHIVPAIRDWVIILHQSFASNHREAEPVLDMDPLVLTMISLVNVISDSVTQLDRHRLIAEEVLDMDILLMAMRSAVNIMSDSSPELHAEQETVVEMNAVLRVAQWICRMARSTYDIMSGLAG